MTRTAIFDKKNVLVIGGAGFIGSHLCDELLKTSKIICVDNYASGHVDNIAHLLQHPNFIFLRHDITQPLDIARFPELDIFQLKFQGIQEIYYLACPTIQLGFEEYAVQTAKTNSLGVINALELARTYHAKFQFASSRSVYGDPLEGQESFVEEYWGFVNFLEPRACYNEGKRFGETLTDTYHHTYKIDTKISRIFNIYGPRMKEHAGKMIPDFVRAAVDHQDLVIYGDGTHVDSYCYVDDLIQGMVALMQSHSNEPVNFGNPQTHQIIEIAKKIIERVGSKSSIVFDDPISGLVKPALPDISRAKQLLGWFPITDIDVGLQRTVEDMLGSKVLTYQSTLGGARSRT